MKEVRAYRVPAKVSEFLAAGNGAIDINFSVVAPAKAQTVSQDCGGLHGGQRAQARENYAVKLDGISIGFDCLGRRYAKEHQSIGTQAEIGILQVEECAYQEACPCQEHETNSDLQADHKVAGANFVAVLSGCDR